MFDPISFWMQGSVFWIKLFKQQQEAYIRAIGVFAQNIPHEDAAELAREAESMKKMLKSGDTVSFHKPRRSSARKTASGQAGMKKSDVSRAGMVSA